MRTTTLLEEPCNGSLKIGDKIKQVKPIVYETFTFNYVNKIFTITAISKDYIEFEGLFNIGCAGRGTMSFDEFDKYFEKIKPEPEKSWTEWTETKSGFKFRTDNEKYVKVKKGGITVRSSCHPCDKFSVAKGVSVCLQKIKDKESKVEDVKKVDNISNKELLIDLIQSMPGDIIDLSYDIRYGINTNVDPLIYTGIVHYVFRFSQVYEK